MSNTIQVSEPVPGVLVQEGLSVTQNVAEYFSKLVGRKIVNVQLLQDIYSGTAEPITVLVFDDDSSATILCDPEGNGPGFIDIQDG